MTRMDPQRKMIEEFQFVIIPDQESSVEEDKKTLKRLNLSCETRSSGIAYTENVPCNPFQMSENATLVEIPYVSPENY